MYILAIDYAWIVRIGKWVKKNTEIFLENKRKRSGKGIFRAGLEEFFRSIYTANT